VAFKAAGKVQGLSSPSPDTGLELLVNVHGGCALFGLSPRTLLIVIIQSFFGAVKPPFSNTPSVVSIFIALGTFFSQPVSAQQNALEPIVITASKFAQPVGKVLADVTVINAQQIESSTALTLAQLLAQLAGAEIAETGGVAKSTGLFLRGAKTAQTIILIDGRRVENASSGGGALELISLSSIDRIEIVRGPVSSLYGSGGIGGVIQIFTKNQIQNGNARVELGTQGHRLARAGTGSKLGDVSFSVNLSHQQTKGFDATLPTSPDAQLDKDGSKQNGANLGASWQILKGHALNWSASINQGNTFYDSAFSEPANTSLKFSHWNTGLNYRAQLNEQWKSDFKWSRALIYNEYAAFTFAPRASTQVLAWENSVDLKQVLQGLNLLAGIEKQDQTVRGQAVEYTQDNRQTRSFFAGLVLEQQAHQFRLHARSDRLSTTHTALNNAGQTSYSVAYGYQVTPQ
jgi:vitamin B12 transporter